jgi:predicted secreted protein
LAASFNLSGAVGFVSTRIKMGKTSEVDALVTAGGSTTKVTKEVSKPAPTAVATAEPAIALFKNNLLSILTLLVYSE